MSFTYPGSTTASLLLLQYATNYSKQTYFSQLVLLISDWMLMSAISLGIHGKVILMSGQVGSLKSTCNHITCHRIIIALQDYKNLQL